MAVGTQVSADILQLLCTEDQKGAIGEPDSHHFWFRTDGVSLSLNRKSSEELSFLIDYEPLSEEVAATMHSSSVEFFRDKIEILYSISDLNNLRGSQIGLQINRTNGAFIMMETMVGVNYFSKDYKFDPELFERTKISGRCEVLLGEFKF